MTDLTLESEPFSLSTEDISLSTESVGNLSAEIETKVVIESSTISDDLLPTNDCSECLDIKYLSHYFAKGCKPVYDDHCNDCPKKFDCSHKEEVIVGNDG